MSDSMPAIVMYFFFWLVDVNISLGGTKVFEAFLEPLSMYFCQIIFHDFI